MDTINQQCPQCQAMLELPASAAGRLAKCPACQQTFRVPAADAAGASGGTYPNSPSPSNFGVPPTSAADSSGNPFTSEASGGATSSNPYAVNKNLAAVDTFHTVKGDLLIVRAKIDAIVSTAIEIFSARWQPLVLGGLIVFGLTFAMGLVLGGIGFAMALAQQGGGGAVGLPKPINFALQVGVGFLSWYVFCGLIRIGLLVARGAQASPMDVFYSPAPYLKLMIIFLPMILIGATPTLFAPDFNAQGPGDFDDVFLSVGISLGVGLLQALLLLVIWPTIYVVMDGRASGLQALSIGTQIGTSNLLNSFLLAIVTMILGLAAVMTCGFGAIVTQPCLALVGTVAYLMMTSQPVVNPKSTPNIMPNYNYMPPQK